MAVRRFSLLVASVQATIQRGKRQAGRGDLVFLPHVKKEIPSRGERYFAQCTAVHVPKTIQVVRSELHFGASEYLK